VKTPESDIKLIMGGTKGDHAKSMASCFSIMSDEGLLFTMLTRGWPDKEVALRNIMDWASKTPVAEVESEIRRVMS